MYKAIIFDLGKVVFDLSFDRVFQSWATASGKSFDEIKNKFTFDNLFDQFERNEVTATQFRNTVSQRLNFQLSDEEFDACWCNLYLDIYPGIDDLLINLKQHYKLVALTNTNYIHDKVWRKKYAGTLTHFEKIYASHDMGTRKPEAQAYQLVLDYLGCDARETIFLDDNKNNVAGAKQLGIETILVTSFEQLKQELWKHGL